MLKAYAKGADTCLGLTERLDPEKLPKLNSWNGIDWLRKKKYSRANFSTCKTSLNRLKLVVAY